MAKPLKPDFSLLPEDQNPKFQPTEVVPGCTSTQTTVDPKTGEIISTVVTQMPPIAYRNERGWMTYYETGCTHAAANLQSSSFARQSHRKCLEEGISTYIPLRN